MSSGERRDDQSLTLGAVEQGDGTYTVRVWAPAADEVALVLRDGAETSTETMQLEEGGHWVHSGVRATSAKRYGFLVDGEGPYPDPCSRSQPEGVHGLSAFVSPAFAWTDDSWRRPPASELVIYEMHVGTATEEGTFRAAEALLPGLKDLGVSAVELMPVAAFPGRWNWGYDGVSLFAPFAGYGGPAGLRSFVNAAHAAGIAVILDVVYNHLGPDGDYTGRYSAFYRNPEHETAWGAALNFDGPGSPEVRQFVMENVEMWLDEYHIDGLRFDATHAIIDESPRHILAEVADRARTFDGGRPYLIAETHENDRRYVLPRAEGGLGFDSVWADDFHHAGRTLLQCDFEGHFGGFDGSMAALADVVSNGWRYRGQFDAGFGDCRGTEPAGLSWHSFVFCLENHDQAGNRAFGERLAQTANEGDVRALTMLLLLHPAVPLIFMGQERSAPAPFPFFTDHEPGLGELVRAGRRREFGRFRAFADEALREWIPDPQAPETFAAAKPSRAVPRDQLSRAFVREVLNVRREDPVLRHYRMTRLPIATEVPDDTDVVVVLFASDAGQRLLVLNLTRRATEVKLPSGSWEVVMTSDEGRFGGFGRTAEVDGYRLTAPPRCAVFCRLVPGRDSGTA